MQKIYGYKEKDMIELAAFIGGRKGETLSAVFEKFAEKSGKAKGTVRNLYYALAKRSATDAEFRDKYLGGEKIAVSVIKEFDGEEEKALLKSVLRGVAEGKSVRKSIAELCGDDAKKALRYQNKYRSVLKRKPDLIAQAVKEIKDETGRVVAFAARPETSHAIPEFPFERLKREINGLVERISLKTRRENQALKERIKSLEAENAGLHALLSGENKSGALKYFLRDKSREILN